MCFVKLLSRGISSRGACACEPALRDPPVSWGSLFISTQEHLVPTVSSPFLSFSCRLVRYHFPGLENLPSWNDRNFSQKNFLVLPVCCYQPIFLHPIMCATPWTVARQVPLSMGFLRQEYGDGLPFPAPRIFKS